jgi:hypothetical protein
MQGRGTLMILRELAIASGYGSIAVIYTILGIDLTLHPTDEGYFDIV